MREFVPLDEKETKKSTRIAGMAAGFLFLILGIFRSSVYAVMIGAVMIASMMLRKKISVTDDGIVTLYDVIFYQYIETWKWNEIKEIHKEPSPDGTKYALHFMKDIMTKRLVYSADDAMCVLDFASEMNPKIHIADVDK